MDVFEAISLNLAGEVKKHIQERTFNLDAGNSKGEKPVEAALDAAIHWHTPDILHMLLAAGADVQPLFQAIDKRLEVLPQALLDKHNSTAKSINSVLSSAKGKESRLDDREREKLKAFLISAQAFDGTSSSLRDRTTSLHAAIKQRDDTALDAAVAYLIDVARFEFEAMRLRMDAVTIGDYFV